ncbi:MAG: hypothetical protein EHM47_14310, partial [Ignavibacteriales bacterium]
MKKISYQLPLLLSFLFLFTSCEPRNIVDVEENPVPQGISIFSNDWGEGEIIDGNNITAFSESFNSYTIAATSGGNLLRQKNIGYSWIVYETLSDPVTIIHRSSNGFIYGTTQSGQLYNSNTNGRTWTLLKGFNREINSILTANDNSIFIGTSSGLYRSDDEGENWSVVNTGIPEAVRIFSILVTGEGILFAGSSEGLYKSSDNGITWNKTGFNEICFVLAQGYKSDLFAGTSNGVFRS